MEPFDYLIVGAGIAGITMAERLSNQDSKRCLIIDERDHIGGNCYDFYDKHGVLIHKYGPHYFRTNSDDIFNYLSQFTQWVDAEYKVLSYVDGSYYSFPINLKTFEQIIGKKSTEQEMIETINHWRIPIENPSNSEEVIISQVGWKLYEMFFKGYTIKQWKKEPKDLDPSICGRIPIRTNRNDLYLKERIQKMPQQGYTEMFKKMLSSDLIKVQLNTSLENIDPSISFKKVIYTGPIDRYFNYQLGRLPYRSLEFKVEHHTDTEFFQPEMQVNYPNEQEFTRIVEYKHLTKQQVKGTTIVKEYPKDYTGENTPYYPIPSKENQTLYQKYKTLAQTEKSIYFLGRLATYKYYNMDQVIGSALTLYKKLANCS